jgi:hypothetical protein
MQERAPRGLGRKETRLSEPLRSESEPTHAADLAPVQEVEPIPGVPSAAELIAAQEARRERRARRKNLRLVGSSSEPPAEGDAPAPVVSTEPDPPREVAPTQKLIDAEVRRMSRELRQHPEISHRAERKARAGTRHASGTAEDAASTAPEPAEAELPAGAVTEGDAVASGAEADTASKAHRRRANTAEKARRKNTAAISEENTLLVRQLSLTMQQLNAAHRVIGRLSAERDILRQHYADAIGIPVDEVVIATDTSGAEIEQKKVTVEAKPPSRWAKLNYFGGPDIAQVRRRRQTFVAILFACILVLWGLSRAGYWTMPNNISRDSLGSVPYIGDLMTYFLAGWLFFRVAKVSSKGVRWVFPSESRQRRRR